MAPRVGLERLLLVQEGLQRLNPRAVGRGVDHACSAS